ncbi:MULTISPECIES: DUF7144 family membrane protein [Geodermatophilus]|uniref:DUF7144 domain-containing protein n=1 Tax=Geodermatophilus arenarius TaxID=1137990 RepID=A0ABV9LJG1_9ACTN
MTDTSRADATSATTSVPRPRHEQRPLEERPPSGWAGWVVFAGVMLVMLGTFQVIQGLIAVFDDGFYLVTQSGLAVNVDYDVWGWTHMVIGVVGVATGLGLLAGNTAARVVGVCIAFLSALVNLAFIAAYPVWSVLMITIDVIVIYAITVHGRELRSDHR